MTAGGGSTPPRYRLIVGRYHRELYEYVRGRFAREQNVEVILDRRSGRDRRTLAVATSLERRTGQRRVRPHIDTALRVESMQFVTIPPSPACPVLQATEPEPTTGQPI